MTNEEEALGMMMIIGKKGGRKSIYVFKGRDEY